MIRDDKANSKKTDHFFFFDVGRENYFGFSGNRREKERARVGREE